MINYEPISEKRVSEIKKLATKSAVKNEEKEFLILELQSAINGMLSERLVMRDIIVDIMSVFRFNKKLVNMILGSRAEPVVIKGEGE